MSPTAKLRLTIFIIITLVVAMLVLFEPRLNIGSKDVISIFEAFKTGVEPTRILIARFLTIVVAIFGALFFLIGLEPKSKNKAKKAKPRANS